MEGQFLSCVPTTIKVEQMKLIKKLIEVRINDDQLLNANFKDGLKIEVKSEKPFIVNVYWIVKIIDIHREIEKDWRTLHKELAEGKFLCDNRKSLYQHTKQYYQTVREQVQCEIRPTVEIDTSQIQSPTPRDYYPLVIKVTCQDDEETLDSSNPSPTAVAAAANIHIVHIRDTQLPIKTHVIKQYIKQTDGRILDISQLYAEDSAACFICFEEASLEEQITLFCLLPCRHSPICSNCIVRIRECPKCRCHIASVFDVNAPQLDQADEQQPRPTIDPSLSHLYDDADRGNTNGRRQGGGGGFCASLKSMLGI